MSHNLTKQIKKAVLDWGADLVGIADVESIKSLKTSPADLLRPFSSAISIALQLPVAVFESITDQPTPEYSAVYQTANRLLDEIAFKTSRLLQKNGEYSLPVPASQVLDRKNWMGAISHKAVARMAGLGWQGKNLLLITPQFGSRVRLVTVLSGAVLDADLPMKNRCGACHACKDACPAQAIKGINTIDHYRDRDEALFFFRCAEKLSREFAVKAGIGAPICGICIRVCPFGRKPRYKKKEKRDETPSCLGYRNRYLDPGFRLHQRCPPPRTRRRRTAEQRCNRMVEHPF